MPPFSRPGRAHSAYEEMMVELASDSLNGKVTVKRPNENCEPTEAFKNKRVGEEAWLGVDIGDYLPVGAV